MKPEWDFNLGFFKVIQRMSGIEISEEVTESQLEAVCGGPVLLAEAGFFTPIRYNNYDSNLLFCVMKNRFHFSNSKIVVHKT